MSLNRNEIKARVADSNWRYGHYGLKPSTTFADIVTDSFDNVKRLGNSASHCNLDDMYTPFLGEYRKSPSYSALAPANGMSWIDRHSVGPDLRPYKAYNPKQAEWRELKAKSYRTPADRVGNNLFVADSPTIPLPPTYRRCYQVPVDPTRFENFARYWGGRAHGLEYSQPFLYDYSDNYGIAEDRRYHRLPHAPGMVPSQPSCRHGRQLMLTPY
uniref:Uncharacterized protein n=1 Tax=Panagrellus redivivus TaxID=6233 RepID=A0A7E4VJL7_PANRE